MRTALYNILYKNIAHKNSDTVNSLARLHFKTLKISTFYLYIHSTSIEVNKY